MHSIPVLTALLVAAAKLAGSQSVDPNSVPIATREQWCNSQITSCPLLCLQITDPSTASTESNTCDATTLTYSCVCANGQQPNASEYTQTLPYYLCTQANNNCVNNCAQGDSACQTACRTNNPCGAQNPTKVNTTSSAATATKTGGSSASSAAGTSVYTGFGGASSTGSSSSSSSTGSSSSSGKSGATALLDFGQVYGLGVVSAGLFAGFTMLL